MNQMQQAIELVVARALSLAANRAEQDLRMPGMYDEAELEYYTDALIDAAADLTKVHAEWKELRS